MPEYTRHRVTTTRVEYILPHPATWEDLEGAMIEIRRNTGNFSRTRVAIEVRGGRIVLSYPDGDEIVETG